MEFSWMDANGFPIICDGCYKEQAILEEKNFDAWHLCGACAIKTSIQELENTLVMVGDVKRISGFLKVTQDNFRQHQEKKMNKITPRIPF